MKEEEDVLNQTRGARETCKEDKKKVWRYKIEKEAKEDEEQSGRRKEGVKKERKKNKCRENKTCKGGKKQAEVNR